MKTFTLLLMLLLPYSSMAAESPMTVEDMLKLAELNSLTISPDGQKLAFTASTRSLETNKSTSHVMLLNLADKSLTRAASLGDRESSPAFSPDGTRLALVSANEGKAQVWVVSLDEEKKSAQVTTMSTGASSPRWTPDSGSIVFTSRVFSDCTDDFCNKDRLKREKESQIKAKVFTKLMYRHWDHWRDGRVTHLFVTDISDMPVVTDLMAGDSWGVNGSWDLAPNGTCVAYTTKDIEDEALHTNNDIYLVPVKKGGCEAELLTPNPALDESPVWAPNNALIAYTSHTRPGHESDRFTLTIKKPTQDAEPFKLAPEVDRWVGEKGWFPSGKRVWFIVGDKGRGALYTALAEPNATGARILSGGWMSNVTLTPSGDAFYFVKQSLTEPMEIWTCKADGLGLEPLTEINKFLENKQLATVEDYWWEGANGDKVHGFLLFPPGTSKDKHNPFLLLIHGGPQGMWSDRFHPRWNAQVFAAPGYVTLLANPRGSSGYGQKFVDEISRDWGGACYEDLMKGVDALIKEGWIDSTRMAAGGGSFGGYMANWILGHTDRFKCLFTHAGVYDLVSMYGSTEELWFPNVEYGGAPWDAPEDYKKFSPSDYVKDFKTPTMVIHGAYDFRVPLNQAMQLFTALQLMKVPSKFLYFPEESHFVMKAQNTKLWYDEIHSWLREHMGDK
jgi:dipeptidyl aminopeptidase/acylaminoacyl peptidase